MDDINSIKNFDVNENRPIQDNHIVTNDILNGCSENKPSTVEPAMLFQCSPVTEKQVLTNVNNNCHNDKLDSSLSIAEYSSNISINPSENITIPLEAETMKTASENSCIINEAASSIETSNNTSGNLSFGEIPVGNVSILSNALSGEISGEQKNLINSGVECNEISDPKRENITSVSKDAEELKDDKNNSYPVLDLFDFSFREQGNITADFRGSLTDGVVLSDDVEVSPNRTLEEISNMNFVVNTPENQLVATSDELVDANCAMKISEVPATNSSGDSVKEITVENSFAAIVDSIQVDSPIKVLENTENKTDNSLSAAEVSMVESAKINIQTDFECKAVNIHETTFQVSENLSTNQPCEFSPLKVENVSNDMSDKPLQFSNVAFEIPENVSSNQPSEIFPLKEEKVSTDMSDKPLQFSDSDGALKMPQNSSLGEDKFSPLTRERISFGMSDKLPEQFSDSSFKLSEDPFKNEQEEFSPLEKEKISLGLSDNPPEQFSDFAFKVPDIPTNNSLDEPGGPDFEFKMPEKPLTNEIEEQFVDAAQFFRDPNSFQFLESIRTSTVQPASAVPRSSLYVNFDPLHSKLQTNALRADNCELISAAVQGKEPSNENSENISPKVMNKNLVDVAARESLGNILISFDSPKSSTYVDSRIPAESQSPPKMFTEEEVQQKLKIHELETQEAYLKKQREMEMEIAKRDELLKSQQIVIKEFCGLSLKFSEDVKNNQEKVISLEAENEKLKEDLKTSAEDLQSVENTFTDFYKRYEQCKGMLKTYKDNEEHLKQTILDLQTKAKEQEQMYNMLQERTEEMLEKANVEVDNVKRSGEAQVTVLKAQLKKAEMKISSLECDIKQIKIENSQLGGICDDLMAKVSSS